MQTIVEKAVNHYKMRPVIKKSFMICCPCCKMPEKKQVRFSEEPPTVYFVPLREARGGSEWTRLAIDRVHFQHRITKTERLIGHCLTPEHRNRMRERYLNNKHKQNFIREDIVTIVK